MRPRRAPCLAAVRLARRSRPRRRPPLALRAHRGQHHAGPRIVGYRAGRHPLVGRLPRALLRMAARDEDEDATWVVSAGPAPAAAPDRRRAPPRPAPERARWDAAGRRIAFTDAGDIAVVDTVARTRRQLTRTAATEGDARWARRDTAVTFTRDNGVFLCPCPAARATGSSSSWRPAPRSRRPRPPQPAVPARRGAPAAAGGGGGGGEEEAGRGEEEEGRAAALRDHGQAGPRGRAPVPRRPPRLPARGGQGGRARGWPTMPRYVTESAYTESRPARTKVGDAQERERLASSTARPARPRGRAGPSRGPRPSPTPIAVAAPPSPTPTPSPAPTPTPPPAPDGAAPQHRAAAAARPHAASPRRSRGLAVAHGAGAEVPRGASGRCPSSRRTAGHAVAASSPPTTRTAGSSPSIPATGATRVLHHEHDDAWVRDPGTGPTARRTSASSPTGARCSSCPSTPAGCTSTPCRADGGPVRAHHLRRMGSRPSPPSTPAGARSSSSDRGRIRASATSTRCRSKAAPAPG